MPIFRARWPPRETLPTKAFIFLLGRMAFAPAKNGRMGSSEDVERIEAFLSSLLVGVCAAGAWEIRLYLDGPLSYLPPFTRSGHTPLALHVCPDSQVLFPTGLTQERSEVGASSSLFEVFDLFTQGGQVDDKVLLILLFARSFRSKGASALQRQLCYEIGRRLESCLGLSRVPDGSSQQPSECGGIWIEEAAGAQGLDIAKSAFATDYWQRGQEVAQWHVSMPWSGTFDGTRVGGRSVQAMCLVFPSNVAVWAPVQAFQNHQGGNSVLGGHISNVCLPAAPRGALSAQPVQGDSRHRPNRGDKSHPVFYAMFGLIPSPPPPGESRG